MRLSFSYSELNDANEVAPLLAQFNQQPIEFSPTQLALDLGIASTTRLVVSGTYRKLVVAVYGYPSDVSPMCSQETGSLATAAEPEAIMDPPGAPAIPTSRDASSLAQSLTSASVKLPPNGLSSGPASGLNSELNSGANSNVPTPGPASPTTVSSDEVEDPPTDAMETDLLSVGDVLDNVRSHLPLTTCYYPIEAKLLPLVEVYTSPDVKRALLYSDRMPEALDQCAEHATRLTAALQQLQSLTVAQVELPQLALLLDTIATNLSTGVSVLYEEPPTATTAGCLAPPPLLHETQLQLAGLLLRGVDLVTNVAAASAQDPARPLRCLNLALALCGALATTGLVCCEAILSTELLTKLVELIVSDVLSESVRVRVLQALLRMCAIPSAVHRLACHLDALNQQLAQASCAVPHYAMTLAALLRVIMGYQAMLTIRPALATIREAQALTSTSLGRLADSMAQACVSMADPVFDLVEKPDDIEKAFMDPEQQLKDWLFDSEGRTVSLLSSLLSLLILLESADVCLGF